MLILTGYHKLPDHKMYWETALDTFVLARSYSILCYTFECIPQNLYFSDNEQFDKQDKFSKLLPVLNKSNRGFLKFSFNSYSKSIA